MADDKDLRNEEPDADLVADQSVTDDPAADDVREQAASAESVDEPADESSANAASPKPVKRNRTAGPVKKASPTPKQKNANQEDDTDRVGPVTFTKQSVAELKKVVWPTPEAHRSYFTVVLVFVVFVMVFVSLLDMFFGWGLLKILG